jgi:hypothetical protein
MAQTFRIKFAYTKAELIAYQDIVARRRRTEARVATGGLIVTGFAVGLIAAWLAAETRIVRPGDGALVAVLVFAGFWLGTWSPTIWSWQSMRRARQQRQDDLRGRMEGATMLVGPGGIFTRGAGVLGFRSRSAIKSVTREKDLLLLWTSTDTAVVIPARLLQPAQMEMVLSFADGSKAVR